MNTFRLGLVLLHCAVFLQLSGCASQDEGSSPAAIAGNPLHTAAQGRNPENDTKMDNYEDYISEEYDDDYPRVAFSTKPKGSSLTATQVKGRDRKKNPCFKKRYRNYCVHGFCVYLPELNQTSCRCETGYSGDRCHLFILQAVKEDEDNAHTTALAVMAVVLSLLCLTIIGLLLALRCHKKDDSSVDEKIRLEPLHSSEDKAKTNHWHPGHNGNPLDPSCQC